MVSLYYKSLNSHMKSFRKQLNEQEINDELHNLALKAELEKEIGLINNQARAIQLEDLKERLRSQIAPQVKINKAKSEAEHEVLKEHFKDGLKHREEVERKQNSPDIIRSDPKFKKQLLEDKLLNSARFNYNNVLNQVKPYIKQKKLRIKNNFIHNVQKQPLDIYLDYNQIEDSKHKKHGIYYKKSVNPYEDTENKFKLNPHGYAFSRKSHKEFEPRQFNLNKKRKQGVRNSGNSLF